MHKYLKKISYFIFIVFQIIALTSCGGGSSSGSSNTSTTTPAGPSSDNKNPPTVTILNPTNESTNVSLHPNIQVQFSEPVTGVSTTTVSLHESSPDGIIISTSQLELESGNIYSFNPLESLDYNQTYYVVISKGITSTTTGLSVAETNSYFTTMLAPIVTSPTVDITPSNGTTDVVTLPEITLNFSEPVTDVNTTTVTLHSSIDGSIIATSSIILESENSYSFTPLESLNYNTTYYIDLSDQITSTLTGLSIESTISYFTTTDAPLPNPTVKILSPADNSKVTTLNPPIKLQFSESVTGVNTTNITLHKSGSNNLITLRQLKEESNNIYTFIPTESLETASNYVVEISDEIKSTTSGKSISLTTFTFNTSGPTFAYITDNTGVTVCSVNGTTGEFEDCKLAESNPQNADSVTIDPSHSYAYVASKLSGKVSSCVIDKKTGDLTSCTSSNYTTPFSVTFNSTGDKVYIADHNVSVYLCSISGPGALPSSCASTGANFNAPSSISIDTDTNYAYITNSSSQTMTICSVNTSSDALSNCVVSGKLFTSPAASIFSKNNKFIYVTSQNTVASCPITSESSAIGPCNPSKALFTKLSWITLNNNRLYLADSGNGAISICHEDESSGVISSCHFTAENHIGISGVTISAN